MSAAAALPAASSARARAWHRRATIASASTNSRPRDLRRCGVGRRARPGPLPRLVAFEMPTRPARRTPRESKPDPPTFRAPRSSSILAPRLASAQGLFVHGAPGVARRPLSSSFPPTSARPRARVVVRAKADDLKRQLDEARKQSEESGAQLSVAQQALESHREQLQNAERDLEQARKEAREAEELRRRRG